VTRPRLCGNKGLWIMIPSGDHAARAGRGASISFGKGEKRTGDRVLVHVGPVICTMKSRSLLGRVHKRLRAPSRTLQV